MITANQIMGGILIGLGTLIGVLVVIFGRNYEKPPKNPRSHKYIGTGKILGKNYPFKPEHIWLWFGAVLIIAGTIFTFI